VGSASTYRFAAVKLNARVKVKAQDKVKAQVDVNQGGARHTRTPWFTS